MCLDALEGDGGRREMAGGAECLVVLLATEPSLDPNVVCVCGRSSARRPAALHLAARWGLLHCLKTLLATPGA